MAQIVNLRNARKQKSRAEKELRAEQNRALFGRTRAEKAMQSAEHEAVKRHLDAHKKDEQ